MGRFLAALLTLGAASVPASASTPPETFTLDTGEVVVGEVVERNDQRIVVESALLGRVELPAARVVPPKEPEQRNAGLFGTAFLEGWDKKLNLGLAGSQGGSDQGNLATGFSLTREDEKHRWKILGTYMVGYSDGDLDEHEASFENTHDWLFPGSRWFAFTTQAYNFDDFQDWKHRASLSAGPGYRLVDRERVKLDGRFGLAATYQAGDVDEVHPEVVTGFDLAWKITKRQEFKLSNMVYPTLDALDVRNHANASWNLKLNEGDGISFQVTVDDVYDTSVDQNKNDLDLTAAIVVDF